MNRIYIIKVGTTFENTAKQYGDFEDWTRAGLTLPADRVQILDARQEVPLPAASECGGVVVTGSHAMVTERLPWSERLAAWIPSLVAASVPFLGICYGHQLLAHALGGQVGYHPRGQEIGTVRVDRSPDGATDALFAAMPPSFAAHVTHSQSVLQLPPGAVRLATNAFEPNHAFRVGACAWGVQFHPEYDAAVMRSYVMEQAAALRDAGRDPAAIAGMVRETPDAAALLRRFGQLCAGAA